MKIDIKQRIRNYGLWVSFASLVLLVVQAFGVQIDVGKYNSIVNAILTVLVGLGIVSDPTTETKGYGDDAK